MKILHVIVGLNTGGAEKNLERLVLGHTADSRFDHSIVALKTVGPIGERLRQRGIPVQALEMRSPANAPGALWKLRGIIRASNPDVVHTWMYHSDMVGGLAARAAGNNAVLWSIHTTDMIAGTARSTALIRRLCAWLSRSIPVAILCVAEAARDTHAAIGYDSSRMLVVPNGFDMRVFTLDTSARSSLRRQLGWTDEMVVVGCVARFNYYKDHANLIRAAGLLAKRAERARFLLVGRDMVGTNQKLTELIHQTGYADRFALLGERDDVVACLSAMDVFCQPSRSEAFPTALGEAMAIGLPCVATEVGDTALLLGDAGVLVPKEDAAALAAALERILTLTEEQRQELGARARQRVAENFSMAHFKRRYEDIYLKTVAGTLFEAGPR